MESATMSTSKLTPSDLPTPTAPASLAAAAQATTATLANTARATAFWTAVALPFVYLPLLATGTATDYPLAIGALLALNAVTLLFGHGYDPGA